MPTHRIWVAEVDSEAAGYAMTAAGEPSDQSVATVIKNRPTVELSKLYVKSHFHGQGVADALVHAVLE